MYKSEKYGKFIALLKYYHYNGYEYYGMAFLDSNLRILMTGIEAIYMNFIVTEEEDLMYIFMHQKMVRISLK